MSFEEQFPSLKDKGVDSFQNEDEDDCIVEMEEFWFPQDEIERNCFDKQKVREAIISYANPFDKKDEKLMLLWKELGL
jgi:hypothetical protein